MQTARMDHVTLKLDPGVLAAVERAAADDDVSVGQLIRHAITQELRRRRTAKTAIRADERFLAPLRALLADDFAYAKDWSDLQSRLLHKGYVLAESGGGLIVLDTLSTRICKGSEIGHGYASLLRKFDAPFPGHSRLSHLAQIMPALPQPAPSPRTAPG
jgi:hypothetical protein